MKALIIGISGQDGFYLKDYLQSRNVECIGISRTGDGEVQGDISNFYFTDNLIKSQKPNYIFHLAANSTTRHEAILENHNCISTGTINILESVKKNRIHSKVFITGSGVQFKNLGKAISENDEFDPNSAYSVARISSVFAARYFRKIGIPVYVGYLFHHESPRRKQQHVSQKIVEAVKNIANGSSEKIHIGDTSVKKEWAFAKDIVEGIVTLVDQDNIFEAAIGTGEAFSIKEWLETCFNLIGKNWKDYVVEDEKFKSEYSILYSDPTTINRCGWKPKTSINDLAKIMLA